MKIIKLYGSEEKPKSDQDDPYYSIPSWFGNVQDALEVENIEKESRGGDYAIPHWFGRVGNLKEYWENSRHHPPPPPDAPEVQDSESILDSEKSESPEEPIRFRPHLTSPEFREVIVDSEDLESANPPNQESEKNSDCLEITVNFILDYWKIIVLGGVGLLILLIVIFIIVFFVVIRPGGFQTTVAPIVGTTVGTSTVATTVGGTVTKALGTTVTTTRGPDLTDAPTNRICTNGFDLVKNKCYRLFTDADTKTNADIECVKYSGASLATVRSFKENKDLQNYIYHQHVDKIWLGMWCPGNEKYWCQWDHDQGNLDGYSNFETGYPSWIYGNCTYFNSDGFWISEDCDKAVLPYVCELPTTTEDTCDHNYNNYCYLRQDFYQTFQQGIDTCKQLCATMLSIHSELENLFVKSIFPDVNGYFIMWLGGMAADKDYILWTDRTPGNYHSNYSNNGFSYNGGCLNMNYRTGEWATQNCQLNRWVVCKRKTGVWC